MTQFETWLETLPDGADEEVTYWLRERLLVLSEKGNEGDYDALCTEFLL